MALSNPRIRVPNIRIRIGHEPEKIETAENTLWTIYTIVVSPNFSIILQKNITF